MLFYWVISQSKIIRELAWFFSTLYAQSWSGFFNIYNLQCWKVKHGSLIRAGSEREGNYWKSLNESIHLYETFSKKMQLNHSKICLTIMNVPFWLPLCVWHYTKANHSVTGIWKWKYQIHRHNSHPLFLKVPDISSIIWAISSCSCDFNMEGITFMQNKLFFMWVDLNFNWCDTYYSFLYV